MTAPALFRKTLSGLTPANTIAEDRLRKLRLGAVIQADIKQPRNVGHHRMYWALCGLVAENMPGDYDAEIVSEIIKIRTGHVTVARTRKGEVFIPKSISFAAMDQTAFKEFFDRAVRVVVTDILPGVDSDALRAEVINMIGAN